MPMACGHPQGGTEVSPMWMNVDSSDILVLKIILVLVFIQFWG